MCEGEHARTWDVFVEQVDGSLGQESTCHKFRDMAQSQPISRPQHFQTSELPERRLPC